MSEREASPLEPGWRKVSLVITFPDGNTYRSEMQYQGFPDYQGWLRQVADILTAALGNKP